MSRCFHCNAEHPPEHFARVVENKTPLFGPWSGWRMAGRYLVAPDGQRITPERLRGLAWRLDCEKHIEATKARRKSGQQRSVVTVLRVNQQDWHRERFGSVAG